MQKILLNELHLLAKRLLAAATPWPERATLITLSGDLGAGKTTLVQALAKELGVQETVQSPTYVLMKKYKLNDQPFDELVHIDAYRLNNKEEFEALDPDSFLKVPRTLVAVEWPERVEGALPKPDIELKLSSDNLAGGVEAANDRERYIDGI